MKKESHTQLTVLTPIGAEETVNASSEIARLTVLLRGSKWVDFHNHVFTRCSMVHMARFQIIDHMIPQMGERAPDSTASKYLLFIAEVDGSSDDLYDHLYRFDAAGELRFPGDGGFARRVWGNCRGFPGRTGEVYFRRYMRRFEVPTSLAYAGSGACTREILEALLVRALWRDFPPTEIADPDLLGAWSKWLESMRILAAVPRSALIDLLDWLNGDTPPPNGVRFTFADAMAEIAKYAPAVPHA